MGKRKDIQRDQSETSAAAEAVTPPVEAEAASVEMAAAIAPEAEMKIAEPAPAEAPSPETIMPSAPNRFALLAASVALAAGLGAVTGSLATMGIAQALAPSVKAADASPNVAGILAQVNTDVAALKASIDASSRLANTQFAKITERFDRVEQRVAAAPAPAPEITGSVADNHPPARTETKAEVKEPPKPAILEGWIIRDIYRGRALVESRNGLFEIAPGSNLPGVGRVGTITQQNGRWIVVTPKGLIVSMR
jgi:hypothetical protein